MPFEQKFSFLLSPSVLMDSMNASRSTDLCMFSNFLFPQKTIAFLLPIDTTKNAQFPYLP